MTHLFLRVANSGAEWVLWLLIVLSFVSIAIIVDRILYFRLHRVEGDALRKQLQQFLYGGDIRGAWNLVSESDAIESAVVKSGLESLRRGPQACGEAMLSAKAHHRQHLEARLGVLGTIGANAPFVGLLGTVLGIIKAANDLAVQTGGQADPNAVMAGVFEALVATAVGLFVAIPAVVAFNYFQRTVCATSSRVDSLAHLVLSS